MQKIAIIILALAIVIPLGWLYIDGISKAITATSEPPPREMVPNAYRYGGRFTTGKCYRCHCRAVIEEAKIMAELFAASTVSNTTRTEPLHESH